jgi:excisionase family DNA binding protein
MVARKTVSLATTLRPGVAPMTEPLLTAREVADWFEVSPETVLRWTRAGKLPRIKLPGGAIRFREAAIEASLEAWATAPRGSVTTPAGRRPRGKLTTVTTPHHEEE